MTDPKQQDNKPVYIGHKAYANSAALYFAADTNREGHQTIKIEGALRTADEEYDWKQKVQLQVTLRDLSIVTACLAGYLSSLDLPRYGASNNKSLLMKNQVDGTFIRLLEGEKKAIAVPVIRQDRYLILGICLRQMQHATPWMRITDILKLLETNYGANIK